MGLVSITQPHCSQFNMVGQSKHWCFTINNWTRADEDTFELLGDQLSYLVYGYEEGEQGTPHLQGYLIFKDIKRFGQVQALLPWGAHIEQKRGSSRQAAEYCKKGGLFKEVGSIPRSGSGGQFDEFIEWVKGEYTRTGRKPTEREIANEYPALFVRYGKRVVELVHHVCPQVTLEENPLRTWQEGLHQLIDDFEADPRHVVFYVDEEGGKGKSYFQRWMLTKYPQRVQLLGIGKRDDLAHTIDESKDVFLINVPRGQMEFLQYTILEQLKDRVVFSPKYNSRTKFLQRVPWVIVFSNEMPDFEKMTNDRYLVQAI